MKERATCAIHGYLFLTRQTFAVVPVDLVLYMEAVFIHRMRLMKKATLYSYGGNVDGGTYTAGKVV